MRTRIFLNLLLGGLQRLIGLNDNIFGQCFESISTRLKHSDGYVTGFTGVDVSYDARFACMRPADDLAMCAVFDFARSLCFHFHGSILTKFCLFNFSGTGLDRRSRTAYPLCD